VKRGRCWRAIPEDCNLYEPMTMKCYQRDKKSDTTDKNITSNVNDITANR